MITVRVAGGEESRRVALFYAEQQQVIISGSSERFFLAENSGQIVGALRLCAEEGQLVLRTMFVKSDRRGQGIGSRLLRLLEDVIADRVLYCIPYRPLREFYARAGFRELQPEGAPEFLRLRLRRYLEEGSDAILMIRLPSGQQPASKLSSPF